VFRKVCGFAFAALQKNVSVERFERRSEAEFYQHYAEAFE
jgi:hypothetical protein